MDEKEVSEMQEEMMTVLVVEPMKAPYVKSIPNELEDLQQAVGGDIEMTYPFEDEVGILLNSNGKFEGLPLNRALYDDRFNGNPSNFPLPFKRIPTSSSNG